jgi:hypothetical protein
MSSLSTGYNGTEEVPAVVLRTTILTTNNVVNNNCTNEEMVVYHQSKYPAGRTCVKQNVAERHNNNNVASYLLYFLNS